MGETPQSVLEVRDLVCQRDGLTLRVPHAAFVRDAFHLIVGESGAGHELLVRVLGLLEAADAGEVWLEGAPASALAEDARLRLRERRLGFLFTAPFLLPAFSVIENVAMPLFKIFEVEPEEARRRSEAALEFAGLLDLAQTPCEELSPFDQRRASLARALASEPAALLIEGLDHTLAGDDLRAFAALLRQAGPRLGVAVIAAVSREFPVEDGDRVLAVNDGVAAAAETPLPGSNP